MKHYVYKICQEERKLFAFFGLFLFLLGGVLFLVGLIMGIRKWFKRRKVIGWIMIGFIGMIIFGVGSFMMYQVGKDEIKTSESSNSSQSSSTESQNTSETQDSLDNNQPRQIETIPEINFADFSILPRESTIEGNVFNFNFAWRNDSLPNDTSFIQAQIFVTVKQGETTLEENDNLFGSVGGNVSYGANQGIETPLAAKYTLTDNITPIEITFSSNNEYDEPQSFTVNIQ